MEELVWIFGKRIKEHLQAPFPIYYHASTSGHHTKLDNFFIVSIESHTFARTIKETIFIRINDPSLNRNTGKYQLPHIEGEILSNTLTYNSNRTPSWVNQAHCARPTYQPTRQQGATLCLQHQQFVDMGSCNITSLVPYNLANVSSLCTTSGAVNGKY